MNPIFNTNPAFLSSRLFCPQRPRIGAITYLNVNILPDFVEFIKTNFTAQELISLSEYQLQTYLMELSIKQKILDSFDNFVGKIVSHIRERKEFWINGKIVKSKENQEKQKQQKQHQHEAIIQFQKDVQIINKKMPDFPQKSFNNYKKRKIQPLLQRFQTDFMGMGKEVLKLNFTNYSMMPSYVLQAYLSQKQSLKKLPNYQNLSNQQKKLLKDLQNALQYFLMSQRPRSLQKYAIKTRELIRNRSVPSYLENRPILVPGKGHIQQVQQSQSYEKQSYHFHNQHAEQAQQQEELSSQQNQFYHNFHETIKQKQFYQSKMFQKQVQINQSHNLLQILKCLTYLLIAEDQMWFQKTWKQMEEQRILRQKRKKQQQQQDDSDFEEQEKQNQGNNQQKQYQVNQPSLIQQNRQKISQIQNHNQTQQLSLEKQKQNKINEQNSEKQQDQQSQNSQNQEKIEEQKPVIQQQEIIQIGIKKPIFNDDWKNSSNFSFRKLSRNMQYKFFSIKQIYFITKEYLKRNIAIKFNFFKDVLANIQNKSKNIQDALVNPDINLEQTYLQFKQMIEHPENVKLGAFKTEGIAIPWDQTDHLLFLKGLLEFFFIPTNNKKIAQYMMSKSSKRNIEANHVKYVKGIYLKNMQTRIQRGESGGGKKGRMLGKTQFLQKDIQFFSMRWFDKIKKSKKKKNRKRAFQDEDDAAEEIDSAY